VRSGHCPEPERYAASTKWPIPLTRALVRRRRVTGAGLARAAGQRMDSAIALVLLATGFHLLPDGAFKAAELPSVVAPLSSDRRH
jgi:hypothetical protein